MERLKKLTITERQIFVPRRSTPDGKDWLIERHQVVAIEAVTNYSIIHLLDKRQVLLACPLIFWERELTALNWPIVRSHDKWIVNWENVTNKGAFDPPLHKKDFVWEEHYLTAAHLTKILIARRKWLTIWQKPLWKPIMT